MIIFGCKTKITVCNITLSGRHKSTGLTCNFVQGYTTVLFGLLVYCSEGNQDIQLWSCDVCILEVITEKKQGGREGVLNFVGMTYWWEVGVRGLFFRYLYQIIWFGRDVAY